MTNNTAAQELSRLIIRLLRMRNYLDTARLASECHSQETGQNMPFNDVLEDGIIIADEIYEALDEVRSRLQYGEPKRGDAHE